MTYLPTSKPCPVRMQVSQCHCFLIKLLVGYNTMSSPRLVMYFDVQTVNYILQAYLVYKYRGKNNEVQHTTMMSKGGGSRQLYGTKPTLNTDTITSNANSTFEICWQIKHRGRVRKPFRKSYLGTQHMFCWKCFILSCTRYIFIIDIS